MSDDVGELKWLQSIFKFTLFLSSCICLSIVSSQRMQGPYLAPRCTRSSWNNKMSLDVRINKICKCLLSGKVFELLMYAYQNKCPPKGCILILTQGEPFFSNLELQIYGKAKSGEASELWGNMKGRAESTPEKPEIFQEQAWLALMSSSNKL